MHVRDRHIPESFKGLTLAVVISLLLWIVIAALIFQAL